MRRADRPAKQVLGRIGFEGRLEASHARFRKLHFLVDALQHVLHKPSKFSVADDVIVPTTLKNPHLAITIPPLAAPAARGFRLRLHGSLPFGWSSPFAMRCARLRGSFPPPPPPLPPPPQAGTLQVACKDVEKPAAVNHRTICRNHPRAICSELLDQCRLQLPCRTSRTRFRSGGL